MLIENLSLMSLTLKWDFITETSEFVEDKQTRAPELIRKKKYQCDSDLGDECRV